MNTSLHAELRVLARLWIALLALAASTIGLALLPLGKGNAVAALVIALAKAGLVLAWFMELRERYPVLRATCVLSAAMLFILAALSAVDYLGRAPATLHDTVPAIDRPSAPSTPR